MDLTVVRDAGIEDARRLLEIYRYYVERTAISFEYDVPTLAEFQARIRKTAERYPYLVVEQKGIIQGFAYAGPFVGRAAYGWSCELTIYLDKSAHKRCLGRKQYEELEEKIRKMRI